MPRRLAMFSLAVSMVWAGTADAQVYVRAPFVRVQVGGPGVSVQAPFVNLNFPRGPGYYVPGPVIVQTPGFYYSSPGYYYPPPPVVMPSPSVQVVPSAPSVPIQPRVAEPRPAIPQFQPIPDVKPAPKENDPPQPLQPTRVPSLDEFAKSFQPRAGSFEIVLMNPVTNEPATIVFSLPEGTPTRVSVNRNQIEFHYGIRRFVRIEFDRDGAMVSSRL